MDDLACPLSLRSDTMRSALLLSLSKTPMPLHVRDLAPAPTAAIAVDPARLALPVEPYTLAKTTAVRWDYIIFFATLHLVALLVLLPYFFTWQGVATFVIGVLVFGQLAIPIGYHRLLAHKSFQCSKWFERTLVTLAMCTAQETPAQWVAWHRRHHVHSDQPDDPHTPRVSFLWSHINWLIFEKRNRLQTFSMYEKYARDILSDRYYLWIEKLPSPQGCTLSLTPASF